MRLGVLTGFVCLCLPRVLPAQATSFTISTIAGSNTAGFSGDGAAATSAKLNVPISVSLDSSRNLYIADSANDRIRKVTASTGKIATFAGSNSEAYAGDGGAATSAALDSPYFTLVDPSGNVYISDLANQVVREVNSGGTISTIAGNNQYGFTGDGTTATNAEMNHPFGLAMDSKGDLYIADSNNHRIRMVATDGTIFTVAGNGAQGFSGDGGSALNASLNTPFGVAIDSAGNLFIADSANHRIRRVGTNGTITTVAGNGKAGFSGDGGPATAAQLNRPWAVAVDASGTLYIADYSNSRIRQVTPDGVINTIAGGTGPGYTGDGGPALNAKLNFPTGVAVDSSGNVYVADSSNNVIRLLTPTPPVISGGGVVSAQAFGAFTAVAPGSWIEIYGTNLAVNRRSWGSADFQGANAPTSLDGTTVTIDGQQAFVDFISGGQVNAQVPSNVATGSQQLVVKVGAASSAAYTLTVNSTEPGMLAPSSFQIGGKQYLGALFTDGVTYVLPPGAIAGVPSRRAKAGDTIVIYGVGFGPVTPNIPAGQIVQQSNSLASSVQVFFGGTPATVTFSGLASNSIGLYQINVTVPSVPSSDTVPVTFSLGGASGTQTLYTAVQ